MSIRSRREALLAGIALLATPAVLRAAPTRMRIGHGLPPTHPVHPSMQHFADIVRDRTGGALEIAIFPDGQIGQEANLLAQVQAGKLDFVKASASVLERAASAYRVFSLPFVFRDHAHWTRVTTNSVGESILASTASIGLVGLTYYDAGARSFYGRKAINHPDDLKGHEDPHPAVADHGADDAPVRRPGRRNGLGPGLHRAEARPRRRRGEQRRRRSWSAGTARWSRTIR